MRSGRVERELVWLGGGHAHVQVLRDWMRAPVPGVRPTLVVDRPVAIYSGMVPAHVAGEVPRHALEIDVWPLARRAGARIVVAAVTGLDPDARRVHLEGRPPLRYDLLSVNTGSTVAGLDTPGVREHAVPTRPIGALVDRIDAAVARAGRGRVAVVVVGGGAGGVELAFALEARLRGAGSSPAVTLVDAAAELLRGSAPALGRRVRAAAGRRGIALRLGQRVVAVHEGAVELADGTRLPADLVVWAGGAAPGAWQAHAGLARDERGFFRVDEHLRAVGRDDVFAAGDCAVPDAWPGTPRAGVYAVRMGPVLAQNLRAALVGGALRRYRPQRDFLALLNLGDGTAIGARSGLCFEGRWVHRLKARIDGRFMERFQALGPDGAATAAFPALSDRGMPCAGCAAKVGPEALRSALSGAGLPADGEDAAQVAIGGTRLAWTVDAFPACTDDPWLVGRIAASHALADLWAKGVRPAAALALVTVPDAAAPIVEHTLGQVLAGLRAALDPHGVALVGGHSALGDALVVGLSALGSADGLVGPADGLVAPADGPVAPADDPSAAPADDPSAAPADDPSAAPADDPSAAPAFVGLAGARPGDVLLLTRPLGTGILLRADAHAALSGPDALAALASMARDEAAALAWRGDLRAATDVSGFGLAGHLLDLCEASGVGAELDLAAIPVLPGALAAMARGFSSTAAPANAAALSRVDGALDDPRAPLLLDPQTGGGLLLAVAPARADAVAAGLGAVAIGRVVAGAARVRLRSTGSHGGAT